METIGIVGVYTEVIKEISRGFGDLLRISGCLRFRC